MIFLSLLLNLNNIFTLFSAKFLFEYLSLFEMVLKLKSKNPIRMATYISQPEMLVPVKRGVRKPVPTPEYSTLTCL